MGANISSCFTGNNDIIYLISFNIGNINVSAHKALILYGLYMLYEL